MKNRRVSINAGGGGPLLTGTIEESQAFNCHAELRSLAQFGMTLAEPVLQLAPSDCTTKEVSVKAEKYLSLRADECRRGNPVKNVAPSCHPELDSGSIQRCVLPVTLGRSRNKFGMTPTESVLCLVNRLSVKKCAFTMAEILLSLTIIGVVAAITLPSLTGNINERTWNTQRKALYARFSQAIALMPALNGYGTLTEDASGSVIEDTAAETFVTNGLAKVLKINNICDSEHLPDCGLPDKITPFAGTQIDFPQDLAELNPQNTSVYVTDVPSGGYTTWSYSQINSKAAGFETANGESIAVYYNPRCTTLLAEANDVYAQQKMCANFVYDLNGRKGPNTFGKDIGVISVLYPTDSLVVAPIPHTQDASDAVTPDAISGVCKNQDAEYRMPTKEELASLFFNKNIIGNMNAVRYWSSSLSSSIDEAWYTSFITGLMRHDPHWPNNPVRCVKR